MKVGLTGNSQKTVPLKTLFVQSQTEIGGAETALLELLRCLSPESIAPRVATLGFGNGPLVQRLAALGIPVTEIPSGRLRQVSSTVRTIFRLRELVRKMGVRVVVCNGGHPLLFGQPAAFLARRPCVWWVHNTFPRDVLGDGLLGAAELSLGANYLVANSQRSARSLQLHFPEKPISTISPGVDVARFGLARSNRASMRQRLGIPDGDFVCGIFGRLQHNKGQHLAVKALQMILAAGVPARLLIVGDSQFGLDSQYPDKLKRLAHSLNLTNLIHFTGQRTDVPELLAACDVALQPAVVPESFGLTVVEAMAAGVPVVAAGHGGVLEMIDDGSTGLLFRPGAVDELVSALTRLWQAPDLRGRLSAAALLRARENFDASRTAARFTALLEGIPAGHSPATPRETHTIPARTWRSAVGLAALRPDRGNDH